MSCSNNIFTCGKFISNKPLINDILKSIIIGVKSKAQKRVGIYFLIFLYTGPNISPINLGRKLIPARVSQERIISKITRYTRSSKNITIASMKIIIMKKN